MALLQSIEDKQFAANVKMLRQSIDTLNENIEKLIVVLSKQS